MNDSDSDFWDFDLGSLGLKEVPIQVIRLVHFDGVLLASLGDASAGLNLG